MVLRVAVADHDGPAWVAALGLAGSSKNRMERQQQRVLTDERVSVKEEPQSINFSCESSNMQVTLEIPDDMDQGLMSLGKDPARATLEAVAIEEYRSGALTALQMRRLLGLTRRTGRLNHKAQYVRICL